MCGYIRVSLKHTRCPIRNKLGGPQIRPGQFGELENLSLLLGKETRYVGGPTRSPVPVQTMLRCHIQIIQNLHAGPTITIGRHEKGLEITSSGPLFLTIAEYRFIWHDHHAHVNTVQKTLLTELHIVRTATS